MHQRLPVPLPTLFPLLLARFGFLLLRFLITLLDQRGCGISILAALLEEGREHRRERAWRKRCLWNLHLISGLSANPSKSHKRSRRKWDAPSTTAPQNTLASTPLLTLNRSFRDREEISRSSKLSRIREVECCPPQLQLLLLEELLTANSACELHGSGSKKGQWRSIMDLLWVLKAALFPGDTVHVPSHWLANRRWGWCSCRWEMAVLVFSRHTDELKEFCYWRHMQLSRFIIKIDVKTFFSGKVFQIVQIVALNQRFWKLNSSQKW